MGFYVHKWRDVCPAKTFMYTLSNPIILWSAQETNIILNPLRTKLTNLKSKIFRYILISSQSWKPLDQSKRLSKSCDSPLDSAKLFWMAPIFKGWLRISVLQNIEKYQIYGQKNRKIPLFSRFSIFYGFLALTPAF